jgi:hypothetical protein
MFGVVVLGWIGAAIACDISSYDETSWFANIHYCVYVQKSSPGTFLSLDYCVASLPGSDINAPQKSDSLALTTSWQGSCLYDCVDGYYDTLLYIFQSQSIYDCTGLAGWDLTSPDSFSLSNPACYPLVFE